MNTESENMKQVLYFGSKNKSDTLLYLGAMLTNMGKKVLIVDMTANQIYKHSFSLNSNLNLLDFDGVDILLNIENRAKIDSELLKHGEAIEKYDIVMYDVDTIKVLEANLWSEIDSQYFVGDFDLMHQKMDAAMIDYLAKIYSNRFHRLTFETRYQVSLDSIEAYISAEVQWVSMNYLFESDEAQDGNRIRMQHERVINIKGLSRQHKKMLTELISHMYELPNSDIEGANKRFKFIPSRKQKVLS